MDREEERLRAALDQAAPEVDEAGVMESVVRKGRSLRKRRRLGRGGAIALVIVLLALTGFGISRLLDDLRALPGVAVSSPQPAPGGSSPSMPATGDTTSSLADTTTAVSVSTTSTVSSGAPPPPLSGPTTTSQPGTTIEYRNTQYGFSFALPLGWEGYSIVSEQWEGFPVDTNGAGPSSVGVYGPEILIRHPKWTSASPRQDIPVMVFTVAQWDLIQQEQLHVGAAPINPGELGRNVKYVFALPARYNYAFPMGYQEVEKILEGKPLRGF